MTAAMEAGAINNGLRLNRTQHPAADSNGKR
jgi:hypothetical protein